MLDHHSPVLHLIQLIRDEAHRFAVTFHRKRRQMRDRSTELLEIPGVGARTTRRLLEHFRKPAGGEASRIRRLCLRCHARAGGGDPGTLPEVKPFSVDKNTLVIPSEARDLGSCTHQTMLFHADAQILASLGMTVHVWIRKL